MKGNLVSVEHMLPLVLIRLPPVMDMEAMQAFMRAIDDLQARAAPYMLLIDASPVTKFPGAAERATLASWMTSKEVTAREALYNVGSALIITSGPARAILAALSWVHRPVKPQTIVATLPEALEWSCERIREAKLSLTPVIESFRARCRSEGTRGAVRLRG